MLERLFVKRLDDNGSSKSPANSKAFRSWPILSAPKTLNILSSKEITKIDSPRSPCRPARPRSWRSMRRDSCRSVPRTTRPPSSRTSSRSSWTSRANSSSIASVARPKAAIFGCSASFSWAAAAADAATYSSTADNRAKRRDRSSAAFITSSLSLFFSDDVDVGVRPSARASSASCCAQRSCSSSSMARMSPFRSCADEFAASRSLERAPSDGSTGNTLVVFSKSTTGFNCESTKGARACLAAMRANKAALPPRRISVPRPAMFVAMVTAPTRPAWAMISDSRCATWGLAFRTRWGIFWFVSSSEIKLESSTVVVPTRTGRPASW
mmetsp:Transcript_36986/g.118568  ORF Transcript_36986/g.118568 Transcript_36986/m.118568 type:complete len:325 (-) Transcript_36986:1475-2449(-)